MSNIKTPPATATGITQNGNGRRERVTIDGWNVVETMVEELQVAGKGEEPRELEEEEEEEVESPSSAFFVIGQTLFG